MFDGGSISCEITLTWIPMDFTDKSALVQAIKRSVSPGNTSLPEPIVTQFHMAPLILSFNQLMDDTYTCHADNVARDIV